MTHSKKGTENLTATDNVVTLAHALNSAKVDTLADIAFPYREQGGLGSESPGSDATHACSVRMDGAVACWRAREGAYDRPVEELTRPEG